MWVHKGKKLNTFMKSGTVPLISLFYDRTVFLMRFWQALKMVSFLINSFCTLMTANGMI